MYFIAKVDGEKLHEIQEFEKRAGVRLLALSEVDLEPAPLPADLLEELREKEEEWGVCLVAVR
jgi:hypothetical protein